MRFLLICLLTLGTLAQAEPIAPRDGWVVLDSDKPFELLREDVYASARAGGMAIVTQAGPTGAAANRGITIPNNRVMGLFNNTFAVRILAVSTPAMIEAPIRVYLTEHDGGTQLSYKTPSHVFAPYMADAGPELAEIAAELDEIFAHITTSAN